MQWNLDDSFICFNIFEGGQFTDQQIFFPTHNYQFVIYQILQPLVQCKSDCPSDMNPWSAQQTTLSWVDVHDLESDLELVGSDTDRNIDLPNYLPLGTVEISNDQCVGPHLGPLKL